MLIHAYMHTIQVQLLYNKERLNIWLGNHPTEDPVAVQLGGCDPDMVAGR